MGRRRTIASTPERAFGSFSFFRFVMTFCVLVSVSLAVAGAIGKQAVLGHMLMSKSLLLGHALFFGCMFTLLIDFWQIHMALRRIDRSWLEATITNEQLIPSPRLVVVAVGELLDRAYQNWTGRWCILFVGAIPVSLFGLFAYLTSPTPQSGGSLPYGTLFVPAGEFLLIVFFICVLAGRIWSQCDRVRREVGDLINELYDTGSLSSFRDVKPQTAESQINLAISVRGDGVPSHEVIFGNNNNNNNNDDHVYVEDPFRKNGDVAATNPSQDRATTRPFQNENKPPAGENRTSGRRSPFGD